MSAPATQSTPERIIGLLDQHTWLSTRNAINLLRENTGVNKVFDPYKDPDRLLWNTVGASFFNSHQIMQSLTVFQSQLQCYMDVQEKVKKRIHKGTPYHYLGQVYVQIGNLSYAREQFLLAFIEDILTEIQYKQGIDYLPRIENALDCPAPIVLELTFRMRNAMLVDLYEYAKKMVSTNKEEHWLYPETLLLKWRNFKDKNRDKSPLLERSVEESLFHTNTYYLNELLGKSIADRSGTHMEELATYLFSCVDGFEPIPRQQTDAFHFDVVIRNLVAGHPLLAMLGEYIGIESKNVSTTVNAEQLNHFIMKLRFHNMRCGIIFTNEGISGLSYDEDSRYGKSIQVKTFNRDNIVVFDITRDDVRRIIDGDNLISLLLAKYEDIRYK